MAWLQDRAGEQLWSGQKIDTHLRAALSSRQYARGSTTNAASASMRLAAAMHPLVLEAAAALTAPLGLRAVVREPAGTTAGMDPSACVHGSTESWGSQHAARAEQAKLAQRCHAAITYAESPAANMIEQLRKQLIARLDASLQQCEGCKQQLYSIKSCNHVCPYSNDDWRQSCNTTQLASLQGNKVTGTACVNSCTRHCTRHC